MRRADFSHLLVGFCLFWLPASSLARTEPLPDTMSAPAARPDAPVAEDRAAAEPSGAAASAVTLPEGEIACRDRLKELGVAFDDGAPQSGDGGCRLPHPVEMSTLGKDLTISPPALVTCAVAEAAARLVQNEAQQAAQAHLGARITAVEQASGYVCRRRAGLARLSEHAFGNALDIAAFELDNGVRVAVEGSSDRSRRRFIRAVRGAACGPFTTVLGPGTDAAHADHLHLDLATRRGNRPYCR